MVNPVPMKKLWIHNAVQFGYISFFAIIFPAATLIGLAINLFHINFLNFSFTDHLKRRPSVERGSIGVWNKIFHFMSFTALAINVAILTFRSDSVKKLVEKQANHSYDPYSILIIIIIAEHVLILFRFAVSAMVSSRPKWVKNYLDNQNYKKRLDEEKLKKKLVKTTNQMKSQKKIEKSAKDLMANVNMNLAGDNKASR